MNNVGSFDRNDLRVIRYMLFAFLAVMAIFVIGGCIQQYQTPYYPSDEKLNSTRIYFEKRAELKIQELIDEGIITKQYGDQLLKESKDDIGYACNHLKNLYSKYDQLPRAAYHKQVQLNGRIPIKSDEEIYRLLGD